MTEQPPTIHAGDALAVELPEFTPKATSSDGVLEASVTLWESPDGAVEAGVWECTPGTFTAFRDGYDEVAHIVSGKATVVAADGNTCELEAGSTLVTPAGWRGTWTVHESVRKTYVIRTV